MIAPTESHLVEWAWAGAALGDEESGDLYVVEPFERGVLLGVIDGLGHGHDAAVASKEAAAVLASNPGLPVKDLVERCHEALRKTRGAVMSLASLDAQSSTIEWCGVGNVDGILFRARVDGGRKSEAIGTRGGVVGYRLPPLHAATVVVSARDLVVMATDGIRSGFSEALDSFAQPQAIADGVLDRYGKGTDDALVLVARYLGRPG